MMIDQAYWHFYGILTRLLTSSGSTISKNLLVLHVLQRKFSSPRRTANTHLYA